MPLEVRNNHLTVHPKHNSKVTCRGPFSSGGNTGPVGLPWMGHKWPTRKLHIYFIIISSLETFGYASILWHCACKLRSVRHRWHTDTIKNFSVGHLIQRTETWTKTANTFIGAASYSRLSEAGYDTVHWCTEGAANVSKCQHCSYSNRNQLKYPQNCMQT